MIELSRPLGRLAGKGASATISCRLSSFGAAGLAMIAWIVVLACFRAQWPSLISGAQFDNCQIVLQGYGTGGTTDGAIQS